MWKNDTLTTAGCPAGCPRLRNHWGEQRLAPLRTDSLGRLSWGPVPWSADPSGKHCFNRSGRVNGLGKTSWYVTNITLWCRYTAMWMIHSLGDLWYLNTIRSLYDYITETINTFQTKKDPDVELKWYFQRCTYLQGSRAVGFCVLIYLSTVTKFYSDTLMFSVTN